MTLRTLHGFSASLIAVFLAIHLTNHLVGLGGFEAHVAFMRAARSFYRFPPVECLLLVAVAFQIGSGLTFVIRGWKRRRGWVPWLQAGSGLYLALFLLNHVRAVMMARWMSGLDTNIYFAAAGFHVPPYAWFFAPYYFLAILALFAHVGCALYWWSGKRQATLRNAVLTSMLALGALIAALVVSMLWGKLYPVRIPSAYTADYKHLP